jgi:formylglycine-generating enzyme required for sulfatase activity
MRSISGATVALGCAALLGVACGAKPDHPPALAVKPPIVVVQRDPGCPEGMALVPGQSQLHATCIDRWEAALVDVFDDLHEEPHPPFLSVGVGPVRAVSQAGVMPQAYISRNEAEIACRAAGKRLCHEEEWVRACGGEEGRTYPYGDAHEDRTCNDHGRSPIAILHGFRGGAAYSSNAIMNDPALNQVPGTLALTGAHARCKTGSGVFDMVGNLHEWVDDPEGTFVGGYYLDTSLNGAGCKYRTVAHGPSYHDYSTGFRCCADARVVPAQR